MDDIRTRYNVLSSYHKQPHVREEARKKWTKRHRTRRMTPVAADKSSKFNPTLTGKLDRWYGCDLFDLALDYGALYISRLSELWLTAE
jgi:hypothetical protein